MAGITRDAADAFFDLICQDDELLQLEFDEIVAGLSDTPPPPRPPAPPEPAGPPPDATVGPDGGDARWPATRPTGAPEWRRQRSPPPGSSVKGR